MYASRRPDPRPRLFGYHEIFHVLVVIAAAAHFSAVAAFRGAPRRLTPAAAKFTTHDISLETGYALRKNGRPRPSPP